VIGPLLAADVRHSEEDRSGQGGAHAWLPKALVAALPARLGRMVMLSHFGEGIVLPDESVIDFSGEELNEEHLDLHSAEFLTEFRLEAGMPTWRYDIRGSIIEKGLLMPHLQNTAYISYRNLCDRV